MRQALLLASIGIVFVVLFARTYQYEYVWDDLSHIPENALLRASVLDGLFATQHDHMDPAKRKLSGIAPAHDSYRPVSFLSHRLDVALFGFDPHPRHVHNVVLGLLASFVFYFVAASWLSSANAALIATAVFALHPIQVETVAYISARSDLLAGIFGLLAVFCAQVFCRRRADDLPAGRWVLAAATCFLVSLLSKEAYIALPVAVAGVFAVRDELRTGRDVVIGLLAALAAYLVLRTSVAGTGTGSPVSDAFLAWPGVWLSYLRAAVFPFGLSTERLYDVTNTWPGWAALALGAGATFVAWRRPDWRPLRLPLSGLFWMLVLLGLSTFVVVLHGVVADRYAYLPFAGFSVALAWLIELPTSRGLVRPLFRGALAVLAVMWLVTSFLQVPVWKDNHTLYAHALRSAPDSSMAHYRKGYAFAKEGRWEDALPLLERAVELDPKNHRALNNLGVTYMNLSRLPDAANALSAALEHTQATHYRAWYNLAVVHFQLGDEDAACFDLERSLAIHSGYQKAEALHAARCEHPGDSVDDSR